MTIDVFVLKYLMCLPFLLYASYLDIKTRKVSNVVWIVMLANIILVVEYELLTNLSVLTDILFVGILTYLIVLILHSRGALGGADCKLLLLLALLFHNILFILSVFITALIISVLSIPLLWITKHDVKKYKQPFVFILLIGLTINIIFGDIITMGMIKIIT